MEYSNHIINKYTCIGLLKEALFIFKYSFIKVVLGYEIHTNQTHKNKSNTIQIQR